MMSQSKFTLFELINDIALDWIDAEKKNKNSIVGSLIKNIIKQGKLRDAQIQSIIVYLWLKEEGNNNKLSDLIKAGKPFINDKMIYYKGDEDYIDKPAKRYLNRYLQDTGIKELDNYLRINLDYSEYENLIDNIFEDFQYPNYLFSLPMGAGKTFLIASFIYIDLYMRDKSKNGDNYSSNFLVMAPPARKTSIFPSLRTIKLFNPAWILPKSEAKKYKNRIRIEVLDQTSKEDKLQNQSPNLAKIMRTTNGHDDCNVFILNAEKVIPNDEEVDNFDDLTLAQQTKIKRSKALKEALAKLKNITVFLDEAHHSYAKADETKKMRTQLDIINKYDNIKCCVGLSGTPYVNRTVEFNNKKLKIQDIQDIVYYYPLTSAIGNFLKYPNIRKVDSDMTVLINSALDEFFRDYDIKYQDGSLSKIAFYCPSIAKLNDEILPIINDWYDKNNRDKSEILKYYTNVGKKDPERYHIPKENLIHFYNLSSPTSKFRIVLLVEVGTEGWDCPSLTSVVLPRQDSGNVLVLQTTCRCLREVDDASNEQALIYLDSSNYDILDNELNQYYHLRISDINNKEKDYKDYPVYKIKNEIGKVEYNNVYDKYIEIEEPLNNDDYNKALLEYDFEVFKSYNPFSNQIGKTTISEDGLNNNITYFTIESNNDYTYSFTDFIYELEKSSFGLMSSSKLMDYESSLKKIYDVIHKKENLDWIINHPHVSTYDVCKDIMKIFARRVQCKKEVITDKVKINLLDWEMKEKPTIRIYETDKDLIMPENSYDDMEDSIYYDDNLKEIKRRFEDKMKYPNKEKSFNYLPYKFDSSYEKTFLKNVLSNITDYDLEVYYNGYKNNLLESLKIITPYGKYTPDFVILKKNHSGDIEKIMLIETKGDPFVTESKEEFVKTKFLENNPNYSYIRIGDTSDTNEYNKMLSAISDFMN